MLGKGNMDTIFILRWVQEKITEGNNIWALVVLETARYSVKGNCILELVDVKGLTVTTVQVIKSRRTAKKRQWKLTEETHWQDNVIINNTS